MDPRALLGAAELAAKNAYAPYSHFPVGAALLLENGDIITGVNVENASYGLTICAERSAIAQAVSYSMQHQIKAIAVWAGKNPHGSVTPCGACRQVLAEFCTPSLPVIMANAATGEPDIATLEDLLPRMFKKQV